MDPVYRNWGNIRWVDAVVVVAAAAAAGGLVPFWSPVSSGKTDAVGCWERC